MNGQSNKWMSRGWGLLLVAIGIGVLPMTEATAAIIYSDSFSRSGALNGTSPDVVNTGSAIWTANADSTDGTQALNVLNNGAFLPFSPVSGNVYKLSADMDTLASGEEWGALGFAGGNVTDANIWPFLNTDSVPWLLQRGNGTTADYVWAGNGVTLGQSGGASGNTGFQNYSIVLDTTGAQWTAEWFRGATQMGSMHTFTINPTIAYVGFGNGGSSLNVDNFMLTTVVPEPTSVALLGLGALLVWKARRK